MNYPFRPAEHDHSIECLFDAVKSALENIRDHSLELQKDGGTPSGQFVFHIEMQDNNAFHNGMSYLLDGTTICECPPCDNVCCEHLTGTGEDIRFKDTPDSE